MKSKFLVRDVRKRYLEFYKSKNHREINSASLLPDNDPTVLFTTAGMHPLVPYLIGEPHPLGNRLTNSQKCIRTQDIDEVGDDWHCTFFEMLGNWSLGDYFKKDAICWTLEFLTKHLGFKLSDLAVTVFKGDESIPPDNESFEIWKSLGISEDRIFWLGRKDNFWGPVGSSGPCGPDSETFFITANSCKKFKLDCSPACDCGRYVEVCNNVFMEYNRDKSGLYNKLPRPNVDFGMGLLRLTSILNGYSSVYESDIYAPAMDHMNGVCQQMSERERRVIVDHIQAALFAICDGAFPSNVGAGYVVRRLLRRSFRLANHYKLEPHYIDVLSNLFSDAYSDQYPDLKRKQTSIVSAIRAEEEKFSAALSQGLKHLEKELARFDHNVKVIDGRLAFFMFESFGFPLEVTEEIAKERGLLVNREEFERAFVEHQEKSRMAGEKLFKGGLADHSEQSTKLHTATHLLHEALRRVLGSHVEQKGSNITPERLRFDFSHPEKLSPEQLKKVEDLVNEQIAKAYDVTIENMTIADAKERGAIGLFEDRYSERIHVYFIGDFSKEVCGGPHVKNTRELGRFKILKEEASSRGVRRIKAVVQ